MSELEYTYNNCGHESHNTRAVTNAPELVRYDPNNKTYPYFEMEESELGEYVRYDQAAAMLSAKDVESEELRRTLSSIDAGYNVYGTILERAEVAEAELAQIKAQEPVAYRFRHSEQERWHYGETDQSWWEHQPLYAAPVSDSLKAEKNEN